jgi:2-polyprenyl-6-hydroxyphenyl methylase/3-demethylubiquinone-9 3-methyltransferase
MIKNNYDPEELSKFASLAAHWWDPSGDLKTLHQVNPIRMNYLLEKVCLTDAKVVDIGCGGGILSESMAKNGAHVTGIDMNPSVIEVAKLHQLETGTQVEYLTQTAESLSIERPQHYDIVTCFEMLEHVPAPQSIVKAASALVKPRGHLFFSTLNRNLKSYLYAILGAEYLLKLLPKNTHDYAKFIKPSELNHWIIEAGLATTELKGIHYQPFTQVFTLTNNISVNYILQATK